MQYIRNVLIWLLLLTFSNCKDIGLNSVNKKNLVIDIFTKKNQLKSLIPSYEISITIQNDDQEQYLLSCDNDDIGIIGIRDNKEYNANPLSKGILLSSHHDFIEKNVISADKTVFKTKIGYFNVKNDTPKTLEVKLRVSKNNQVLKTKNITIEIGLERRVSTEQPLNNNDNKLDNTAKTTSDEASNESEKQGYVVRQNEAIDNDNESSVNEEATDVANSAEFATDNPYNESDKEETLVHQNEVVDNVNEVSDKEGLVEEVQNPEAPVSDDIPNESDKEEVVSQQNHVVDNANNGAVKEELVEVASPEECVVQQNEIVDNVNELYDEDDSSESEFFAEDDSNDVTDQHQNIVSIIGLNVNNSTQNEVQKNSDPLITLLQKIEFSDIDGAETLIQEYEECSNAKVLEDSSNVLNTVKKIVLLKKIKKELLNIKYSIEFYDRSCVNEEYYKKQDELIYNNKTPLENIKNYLNDGSNLLSDLVKKEIRDGHKIVTSRLQKPNLRQSILTAFGELKKNLLTLIKKEVHNLKESIKNRKQQLQ